ncbi:10658_t:CDS:2, partial [Entrophospora sp. SA101]
ISLVLNKINEELKNEVNLTLGKSIYAFVIITPNRKQYIHSLVDESGEFHTGNYIADEIEKVLTSIGPEKFVVVVSDGEAAMQMARRLISQQYPNILPISCLAHHINLITTDLVKLKFSNTILSKYGPQHGIAVIPSLG